MNRKLRLAGNSAAAERAAVAEQIDADGQRAKALSLGASHAEHDASVCEMRQTDLAEYAATNRLRSKVRAAWRASGIEILRDLCRRVELSIGEFAAMLDLQHQQLSRSLSGRDPFKIEYFVGIAERDPQLGGEVILAYADGCKLPPDVLDWVAEKLHELAAAKRVAGA